MEKFETMMEYLHESIRTWRKKMIEEFEKFISLETLNV